MVSLYVKLIQPQILLILTVPSAAPGNFALDSSSALSLDVKWDAIPLKEQQGKLIGYRVYYRKEGSGVEETVEVRPDQFTYTFTSLEYARYYVRVTGFTSVGVGKFSATLNKFPNEGG